MSESTASVCRAFPGSGHSPERVAGEKEWLRLRLVKPPPVLNGIQELATVGEWFEVCPYEEGRYFACYTVVDGRRVPGGYFVVSEWTLNRCFESET